MAAIVSLNLLQVPAGAVPRRSASASLGSQALTLPALSFRLVISLGGSTIRAGWIRQGKLIALPELSYYGKQRSTEEYLHALSGTLHDAMRALPWFVRWHGRLTDATVGMPGIIRDGRVVEVFNLPLRGVLLSQWLTEELRTFGFSKPRVEVMNDLALEARAEQRHVQGRFLYLNAGTGLNAVVVDGSRADVLEFGALRLPDGTTLEARYQAAKSTNDARAIVASFIDELVRVLAVSDIRQLVIAGGAADHVNGFYQGVLRQLAERRFRDVQVHSAQEPGDLRGLRAPLVHILAPASESPRMAALRARYDAVQQMYELMWKPRRPASQWFAQSRPSEMSWTHALTLVVTQLSVESRDFRSWSAKERQLAGLVVMRIQQVVRHFESELTRLERVFRGKRRYAPALEKVQGWQAPFEILNARLFILENQLIRAAGRHSLATDVEIWRQELLLAGVPRERLGDFNINVHWSDAVKEGTLLVDARDIVHLIGIPQPGASVRLRQNSPEFLRDLEVLDQEQHVLFGLKMVDQGHGQVLIARFIQNLVPNPMSWFSDVLLSWLADRGYTLSRVAYPYHWMRDLPGALQREGSLDIDMSRRAA